MTIKICIDPGSCSGAIAVLYDHQPMQVIKMPPTPKDILTFFKEILPSALIGENPLEQVIAYVEDVGGTRIGNSAKSARTFAVHMGHLEMALLAAGIDCIKVTPTKWMSKVCPGRPKGSSSIQVKTRKLYIYRKMQERYASVKFPKYAADAVGIANYVEDYL